MMYDRVGEQAFSARERERDREASLFEKRAKFIREEYPGDADRMVEEALDGFEVIESRNKAGELIGILTYTIGKDDREKCHYCAIGLILVDEENRGMEVAQTLVKRLKEEVEETCAYYTAKADTDAGRFFLEHVGFENDGEVDGKECFRLDIE